MATDVPSLRSQIVFPSLEVRTGPFETQFAELAKARGWARVAVLAGNGVARSIIIEKRLSTLSIKHRVWSTGPAHAPVETVESIAGSVRDYRPDVVVSVGGGSSHDLAKGVVTLMARGGSLLDHCLRFNPPDDLEHVPLPGPKTPIVTVPSTLSGSEANGAAGFTVLDTQSKRVLADPSLCPTAVLVDGSVLDTTPDDVFGGSVMNALNHAVEGLASRRRNVASEALLSRAFVEIAAATDPAQPVDRVRAATGSILAGIGLSGTWLGLAHAIGHVLGARYRVPHGWCHAVMAGTVVRFNATVAASQHASTSALVGASSTSAGLASWLDDRAARWNLPRRLADLGVRPKDLADLADSAWHDHDSFYNPRRASKQEILDLLKAAY